MEATTVRLYTLNYDEAKTYMWAAVFIVCNLALPQLFHLIPQGAWLLCFRRQSTTSSPVCPLWRSCL